MGAFLSPFYTWVLLLSLGYITVAIIGKVK